MIRKVKRVKQPERTGVKKLLELLPKEKLEALAEQTQVDYQVKKLNGIVFFQLLLHGVLRHGRLSTRLLEHLYNSPVFKTVNKTKGHRTRHSSIADRLRSIKPEFFKAIFEHAHLQFAKQYKNVSSKEALQLLRFDSTMIAIGAGLIKEGMRAGQKPKDGPGKKQLKFTIGLKDELPSDVHLYTDQTYLSEDKAIGEAIQKSRNKSKSILVFDRGITSRQTFDRLEEEQDLFVTRLRTTVVYNFLEQHAYVKGRETPQLVFTEDIIVSLQARKGKQTAHNYRLIKADIKPEGRPIFFLTNIMNMDCEQIAEIYRKRWDIEVFFKFLKQELNAETLLSYNRNGIESLMYVRLIAAMLILLFKKKNNIEGYKIAKVIFESELETEVTAGIIEYCGGNPSLLSKYYDEHIFT
jgi:transposase